VPELPSRDAPDFAAACGSRKPTWGHLSLSAVRRRNKAVDKTLNPVEKETTNRLGGRDLQ
jgi:hypothetical protein